MKYINLICIAVITLSLNSCGVGEAENVADEFHKKLDAGEYTYILENLVYPETRKETGDDVWYAMFTEIEARWGKAKSREQDIGFESRYSDGITRVKLDYTIQYQVKTVYERLFLADNGDGFKVTGFFLNEDQDALYEQAGDLN